MVPSTALPSIAVGSTAAATAKQGGRPSGTEPIDHARQLDRHSNSQGAVDLSNNSRLLSFCGQPGFVMFSYRTRGPYGPIRRLTTMPFEGVRAHQFKELVPPARDQHLGNDR